MPYKLKQLSGKELISIFERFGFEVKSQNGSHIKLKRPSSRIIIVPNHTLIDKGTLKAIYNQALAVIPENELHVYFYTGN